MYQLERKDDGLYVDGKKVIRGWESYAGWYWFAIELDHHQDSIINGKEFKNDKIYYGLVQGSETEYGYFSEAEINSLGESYVWEIPKENLPISGRDM